MTSNQIELRKVKETERANRARESIDIDKLNETIRNNDLVNSVNVKKNQLTRLANDQLNDRELRKLAEQMDLAYDQLNEQAYNNDLRAEVDKYKADLDASLRNASNRTQIWSSLITALGRVAGGVVKFAMPTSTNVSYSSLNDYFIANPDQAINALMGRVTKLALDDSRFFKDNSGGSMSPEEVEDKVEADKNTTTWKEMEDFVNKANLKSQNTQDFKTKRSSKYERKSRTPEFQNEIPEDVSNSRGPSSDQNSNHSVLNANENPVGPGEIQHSVHGTTSGGTDYHISGGHTSSATIVAPRAN